MLPACSLTLMSQTASLSSLHCLLTYFAAPLAAGSPQHLLSHARPGLHQDPHAWHDADADADADADTDADANADADADAETPVEADAASTRRTTSAGPDRGPPPGGLPVIPLLRSSL